MRQELATWAGGWFRGDGVRAAPQSLQNHAAAVFCCNDRLAEGPINYCTRQHRALPNIIGFDDAPIAEALNLTTMAIPWDELMESSIVIIRERLRGDTSAATRHVSVPRPLVRR